MPKSTTRDLVQQGVAVRVDSRGDEVVVGSRGSEGTAVGVGMM